MLSPDLQILGMILELTIPDDVVEEGRGGAVPEAARKQNVTLGGL